MLVLCGGFKCAGVLVCWWGVMVWEQFRMVVALALVCALLASARPCAGGQLPGALRGVVVVYGDPRCHACASLKKFFDENGIRYVFVDLRKCGVRQYMELARMFGLGYYIPLSVVVSASGHPSGVVSGAYLSKDLWERLLKARGGFLVFGEVPEWRNSSATVAKVARILNETYVGCLLGEAPPSPAGSASGGWRAGLPYAVAGVAGAGLALAIVATALRRKEPTKAQA